MKSPDFRSWFENIGFVAVTAALLLLGLLQGAQFRSFTVEIFSVALEFVFLDAVLSSVGFAAFMAVSSIILFWRWSRGEKETSQNGGSITCIIPTYRDSEVLHRSVDSLLESDYDDFEILIVCEEEDENGVETAREFSENEKVDYTVNDTEPGSKAGAINHGAEVSESDHIAVFDSDQVVREDFLSSVAPHLEEDEVVQGRHIPEPEGVIESLAYYESVIFNYIARQIMQLLTGFKVVGSRSTVIRRETFNELNGYDSDTLTEDFDFAHKCFRCDVEVKEIFNPTYNEAAHNLRDWWGQRKRWMTGYFQVFIKSFRLLDTSQGYRRWTLSAAISGLSIVGSILMLTLVSKFVLLMIAGAELIYLLPLMTIQVCSLIARLHDYQKDLVEKIGYTWILTPAMFPFFGLITLKAVTESILGDNRSWYRVQKTG